ncbi:MAG: rhodanese-like domain-containing protein [Candidatus Thiodiazotropha sp.]
MKALARLIPTLLLIFVSTNLFAEEAPLKVDGATTVDAVKAKELFDQGVLFVDPRRISDFEAGRIPDAVSLEMKSVFSEASLAEHAQKSDPIVFYCNGPKCLRSAKVSKLAIGWGYTNVYYFRDGFPAWQAAGYPTE